MTTFRFHGHTLAAALFFTIGAVAAHGSALSRRADQRQTICSQGMPLVLSKLGVSEICIDLDVYGCGETVGLGLRFKDSATYIAQQNVTTTDSQFCVDTADLSNTPLQSLCQSSVTLCVTFVRAGRNTLLIRPDHAEGCPTLQISNCVLPVVGRMLPINLPLDCFTFGQGIVNQTAAHALWASSEGAD